MGLTPQQIKMRKYEIPLRILDYHSQQDLGSSRNVPISSLAIARMLFDGMEEDELYEPAPVTVDGLYQTLKSHPDMDVESYFACLLDADFDSRFENIDVEGEAEKIPKNYDVALALAMDGRLDEAADVIDFLKPLEAKKELDVSDFKRMEKHRELIDELVEERLQQEMEERRQELREQFKSTFIEDDRG